MPAAPARTMKWLPDATLPAAPATPITSDRLLTRPSLTPNIAARKVPLRPLLCHASARGRRRLRPWPLACISLLLSSFPDLGVLALICGDRRCLGSQLRGVGLLLVALEGLHQVRHGIRPERPGQHDDRPHAEAWTCEFRHIGAGFREPLGPDFRMTPLVPRYAPERRRAGRVLLDLGQSVVKHDSVALQLQVREAARTVFVIELERGFFH